MTPSEPANKSSKEPAPEGKSWLEELNFRPRTLAICFFVFSAIIVVLMNAIVPPFAAPDEFQHMSRAASLASGQVLPVRGSQLASSGWSSQKYVDQSAALGGRVNDGIIEFFRTMEPTCCVPNPTPSATVAQSRQIRWASGSSFLRFPEMGQYGPALYLPQAIGLATGHITGLSIVNSYLLARTLTGFTAIALASIAIANAGGGAFVMAVVLSCPMYLFLASSLSQDGLLIAAAALFAAMAAKPQSADSSTRNWVAWVCGLLITMGRTPYALLTFLLIRRRNGRSLGEWLRAPDGPLGPILIGILAASWLLAVGSPRDSRYDRKAQLAGLLQNPSSIVAVAQGTLEKDEVLRLSREIVGVLGWLNIPLPPWAFSLGQFAIALAAATCLVLMRGRSLLECLTAAIVYTLSLGGLYGAAYIAFNPVGQGFVEGVQGRYLLPYLVGLPLIIPQLIPERWRTRQPVQKAAKKKIDPDQCPPSERRIPRVNFLFVLAGFLAWGIMILVMINALFVLRESTTMHDKANDDAMKRSPRVSASES